MAVVFFALGPLQPALRASAETALIHVSIIDVGSGAVHPDMTVRIVGDRIADLRPSKAQDSPAVVPCLG
jgi:hypothetical protein